MADVAGTTRGQPGSSQGTGQGGGSQLMKVLREQVIPVLAALAGAAALVAVIGGMTMWARFFAAEVPPEQAVDAMPDPELIVTGAVALVVFAAGGLLIVTFAYVVDRNGRQTRGMARTLLALAVVGGIVVCVVAEENELWKVCVAAVVLLGAGALIWRWVFRRYKKDEDSLNPGPAEYRGVWYPWLSPDMQAPPMRFLLEDGGRAWLAAITILCAGVAGLFLGKGLLLGGILWGAAIVLVVALLWSCYAVAHSTGESFAWFGVSLFLAVLLFGTYVALADIAIHQRVQPVAVIRAGDDPGQGVLGFYITENDDRLYLATVTMGCEEKRIRKDSGRLFWVEKDHIRAISIGKLQDAEHAAGAPPDMLQDLWAARIPFGKQDSDSDVPRTATNPREATAERRAAELDDESDPGDSPRVAEDDLPEPTPAVLRAPKIHSIKVEIEKPLGKRRRQEVTVNGADFGAAPIVTVDDVRVRKMELGEDYDRHGNSEIEFTVPARAESGRVEVKCGETHPQELVVGRSPSRRR